MNVTIPEVIGWRTDWKNPGDPTALLRRRGLWRNLSRSERQSAKRMLNRYRICRRYEVLERFVFDQFDALDHDSSIELTPDPKDLIEIANRRDRSAGVDPRRWYEGLIAFDMMIVMTLVEAAESNDKLRGTLGDFIGLLEEYVFEGPPDDRVIYSYHQKPNYVVGEGCVSIGSPLRDADPSWIPRRNPLGMRPLVGGGEAYITPRPKGPFWTAIKLYRQAELADSGKWNSAKKGHGPYLVSDRLGIRLVAGSVDIVYDLQARIAGLIIEHGGSNGAMEDNMTGGTGPVDPTNKHSSPNFRACKFDASFKGYLIELQFMTLWDYMTNRYATDEAGWWMYKLRQMNEEVFEFLFPREICGYNWKSDMMLRHRLRQQMIDKLGWARHEASPSS